MVKKQLNRQFTSSLLALIVHSLTFFSAFMTASRRDDMVDRLFDFFVCSFRFSGFKMRIRSWQT